MKNIEKTEETSNESSAPENAFTDRVDSAISMLPDGIRPVVQSGVEWVREHPVQAVMIGTGIGFTAGILGVARVMIGARFLRSVPAVVPGLIAGVATLVQAFEDKKSDERVTH